MATISAGLPECLSRGRDAGRLAQFEHRVWVEAAPFRAYLTTMPTHRATWSWSFALPRAHDETLRAPCGRGSATAFG